ncbi:protein-L-isoaspartate(D-aspartate) O-methyltransferase [Hyphococcus sp.]|uniref:protein-L-isoaspartate(D-aspartate) O-methyltransferase n=1 Tax=Hyphococcus sp. TaxID=2038636 RepID=UPI003CCC1E66
MTAGYAERRRMADFIGERLDHPRVVEAMAATPREEFLPDDLRACAYEDAALPIGEDQTISQPFVVARMIALADPCADDIALEVGAGSGYAAAVLARLCARVFAIERNARLAHTAQQTLSRLGVDNVSVVHGDGTRGLEDAGPFNVIIVSAGGQDIPGALRRQLAIGGRLVMPVSAGETQILTRLKRNSDDDFARETYERVMFVPLVADRPPGA